MKLAILTDNATTYTGREAVCNYMTNFLSENNYIEVLSLKGDFNDSFYEFKGAKKKITFHKENNPLIMAMKYIKRSNFDVVFVVSMGRLSVCFGFLKALFIGSNKSKFVSCEHISVNSLKFLHRVLKKYALRAYHKTVVLTNSDSDYYNKRKINNIVIENPLVHHGREIGKRNYNIIAIGRLTEQKNFSEMIDIFNEFHKYNNQYRLRIFGEGPERESLEFKIKKLNLDNVVTLLGISKNIDSEYKKSDICLMTSRYEGLPMALLEAKSWSIPVIAYDCPTGPKEIINDGKDGFLIDMNDKNEFLKSLNILANDDEVFYRMSYATSETSTRFSADNIRREWNLLLEELK